MIRGVIVDLDGTVYRGDALLPGADRAIERLRERGCRVLFCSNNPTRTPSEYADRLTEMGIDVSPADVLPASEVTREYLVEHHAGEPTYLVGSPSLRRYLSSADVPLVSDPDEASVFVTSWDDRFDYEVMCDALTAVDGETTFVGTDPDRVFPTEDGEMPGSGAITNAVAATVGREPDRVLGKPSEAVADMALDRLDVPAEDCLIVGDRLDTDLALGARERMTTALVLTGVCSRADVESSDVDPDYVLESLSQIDRVFD